MKTRNGKLLVAILLGTAFAGPAHAQERSAEEQALWKVIANTWEMDLNQDQGWMRNGLHPRVAAWGMDYPAPRDNAGIMRWSKINQQMSSMTAYDLSPLTITIAGDTALAHYYYSVASKSAEGKPSVGHGRCSDTLVRQDGRWMFLGWSCSDEPRQDD